MRKLVIWMLLTLGVLGGLMPVVAQNNTMQLRVAHWSSDAPPVDIYANGERVIESLEYPTVTEWMALDEGLYDIAVAPAGTSLDDAVIGPLTFNLVRGTWITIAAVGSVEAGTLATNVLIEDYSPMLARDAESARVSITHAVDGAAPITMMINDIVATTSLAYPGTKGHNDGFFVRNVPAGIADIQVFLTNEPDVKVASASDVTLEAGMNYLLAAIGTADAPELLIVASSFDGEMTMMSDVEAMAADNTTSDETMTEADTSTDEVAVETPTPEADETVAEEVTPEAEVTEVTPEPEMTEEPAMDESMPDAEMTEEPMMDESMPDAEMTEEPTMDESMPDAEMTEEPMMDESMADAEMTEEPMMDESMPDAEMTEEPMMDESMPDAEMTEEPMATEEPMDADMSEISNTIADIVVATEANDAEFSVLLAALMVADESIAGTLGDPDADLTVFAPTDEAFVALLEDMDIDIDTLLSDTDLLNTVLPYHVVEGAVMADTVMTMDGEVIPTLLGDDATISITVTDDGVILNGSIHVIETDIVADNGVIHVIDGVLVPEMETE